MQIPASIKFSATKAKSAVPPTNNNVTTTVPSALATLTTNAASLPARLVDEEKEQQLQQQSQSVDGGQQLNPDMLQQIAKRLLRSDETAKKNEPQPATQHVPGSPTSPTHSKPNSNSKYSFFDSCHKF